MSDQKNIKVFLVDDHNMIVQGLSFRFGKEEDMEICGTALFIKEALPAIEIAKPDVVISDLTLSDGNGMNLIRTLNEQQPSIKCIVVTMQDESLFACRCIRAGAMGYIMKSNPLDHVIDAVRKVIADELYVSDSVRNTLMKVSTNPNDVGTIDSLSDREFEIFCLIGQGFRPRHIAESLFLSVGTVDAHCKTIRSKLQVENMKQLIEKALSVMKSSS